MLELTMAICSILHNPTCTAETLRFEPFQSAIPYQMMKGVEIEMAKWRADHPEWSIMKWALHPPSRIAKS